MKVGLKCVIIPELKYAHLCSESTSLSLRMTFSDSNMTLKISNTFTVSHLIFPLKRRVLLLLLTYLLLNIKKC